MKGEALNPKYEIRILNSNGTIRWVELHGTKIDWQGKPAALNFLKDVTEAKATEKALKESEAKFRYIAENSSDVIWHLYANLICDYISLADEKMRGYTQEEVLGEHLFSILKPGTYDHLITNLQKRFADERAGIKTTIAPNYELEQIPFKEIWSDIINAIEGSANSKGISISNNIPLDLVFYADSNMLKTVLRNLISNAIKFTHKGGFIKLSSVETEEGINISIADTGVGMTQEILSKLFDITNNYTTKGTLNETGSGFGLILCKEFLEKHNGRIWVESEVDKGSIFTFYIPMSDKN